jgi:hypothetical protein
MVAGVAIETPDNLKLYDLTPGSISLIETNAFPTDNANANNTGAVDFGEDKVFALDSNNGIIAARVLPPPVPPTITTQPGNQTILEGEDAPFSVQATGTETLTYQWLFNGSPISGATSSNYTRYTAQSSEAGNYQVIITNIAGAATSLVAVLTVNVAPSIATHPQSQSARQGSNATFTVVADGTAPLYCQWSLNHTNIAGATAMSFTITNVRPANAGEYRVTITNVAGSAISLPALLTVELPPASGFTGLEQLPGGSMRIRWVGDPGFAYTLQTSTNLVLWLDLATVGSTTTNFEYIDPTATNKPAGYYRTRD